MFYRKKITIPAAGETLNIPVGGCAVTVESMNTYTVPEQVPLLFFANQGNNSNPLYPQSTYVAENGQAFDRIVIQGTTESAGDVIYLLISTVAMEQEISPNTFQNVRAVAGTSFEVDCNDTVDQFTELQIADADGRLPTKVYVSPRGGEVVYAFNADPEQAALGSPALGTILSSPGATPKVGDLLEIDGINFILAFRFRAAVSGTTPSITVHLEY